MQSSMLVRPLKTGRHRNTYRSYQLPKCIIFGKKIHFFFFQTDVKLIELEHQKMGFAIFIVADHLATSGY
jgi:hypothetical protein